MMDNIKRRTNNPLASPEYLEGGMLKSAASGNISNYRIFVAGIYTNKRYRQCHSAEVDKISPDVSDHLIKYHLRKKIAKFTTTVSAVPHETHDSYQLGVAK